MVQAIVGEVGAFSDAHPGVAQEQEDVGGEVVPAEQLLLD